MTALTWDALVEREPRLADLLDEAKSIPATRPECEDLAPWYGYGGWPGLKPRLIRLVGWFAETRDPVLASPAAYQVAYDTVLNALPRAARRR